MNDEPSISHRSTSGATTSAARCAATTPTRVDQFRDQVAEELERLTRAEPGLEAKAKGFHEQLRAFRERDKALNDALVRAQQLRAEIREQAEREAQLILREARAEGERMRRRGARRGSRGCSASSTQLERVAPRLSRRSCARSSSASSRRSTRGRAAPPRRRCRRAPRRRRAARRACRRRPGSTRWSRNDRDARPLARTRREPRRAPRAARARDRAHRRGVQVARAHRRATPDVAIILGTGLGGLARRRSTIERSIEYADIPGFPLSTVESHAAGCCAARSAARRVVAMQGRFHRYEGYTLQQVTFPVRVLRALGAETLDRVQRVRRHEPAVGARRPDADRRPHQPARRQPAHRAERRLARPALSRHVASRTTPRCARSRATVAREQGITLREGVYVAVAGPEPRDARRVPHAARARRRRRGHVARCPR